jgi:hypothetical protein
LNLLILLGIPNFYNKKKSCPPSPERSPGRTIGDLLPLPSSILWINGDQNSIEHPMTDSQATFASCNERGAAASIAAVYHFKITADIQPHTDQAGLKLISSG